MKKIIALVLALTMTLCAGGALAACDTKGKTAVSFNDGTATLSSSGSYYVSDNVSGNITVTGTDVKLCLHGKTLSGRITINSGAKLTIEDCTGNGEVTCNEDGVYTVLNQGEVRMTGGTVSATGEGVPASNMDKHIGGGVENVGGTFTMTGGTISATGECGIGVENVGGTFTMSGSAEVTAAGGMGYGVYNYDDGAFTMNGGTVSATARSDVAVKNGARVFDDDGGSEITGGTFTMNGGTVLKTSVLGHAVENDGGEFIMTGGMVSVTSDVANGVENNGGTFTMNGGMVSTMGMSSCGVKNSWISVRADGEMFEYIGGTFTMNGGAVEAAGESGVGVQNDAEDGAVFTISEGRISGGECAVSEGAYPLAEDEAEKTYILPGSYKVSGAFGGTEVVVAKIPGSLPQTGDASMLGAWVMLLGAAGAGLKIRRKR